MAKILKRTLGCVLFFIQKYRIIPAFYCLFILKVLDVSENQASKVIEAKEIMTLLPHRYPFLLVDRVTDYEDGKMA